MSEMIERVAISLSVADPDERGLPAGVEMAEFYRGLARAAIEAMREPTDKVSTAVMIAAGKVAEVFEGEVYILGDAGPFIVAAMIDAALAPSQPPGAEPE